MSDEIVVYLYSDREKEQDAEYLQYLGELTSAAKEERLVGLVCTHSESGEPAVILCAVKQQEGGGASYIPVARLFDSNELSWADYDPPSDVFETEEESDEREEDATSTAS